MKFFLPIITACTVALSCNAECFKMIKNKDSITLQSKQLNFVLSPTSKGLGLLDIVANDKKVSFMKKDIKIDDAKLWRLKLTTDMSKKENTIILSNNSKAASRTIRDFRDHIEMRYNKVQTPGGGYVNILVTVALDNNMMSDWRIKVDAENSKYKIVQVMFPDIELGFIEGQGENDYLLMSPAEGRSVRNPIHFSETLKQGAAEFEVGTSSPLSGKTYTKNYYGFGFGANEPYGLPYPTCRGQMQLNAYYHKNGNFLYPSTDSYGLYLSTHDPDARPKVYYATESPKDNVLRYAIGQFSEQSQGFAKKFEQKFPAYIGYFKGDWYEAAMIYRKWALKQSWSKQGRLIERKDVPEWFLKMTAWVRLSNMYGQPMTRYYKELDRYREILSGVIGIQYYAWEDGRAIAGCGNFPTTSKSKPGFKEAVEKWQKENYKVFPYVNVRVCTVDADKVSPDAEFMKHIQLLPNGKPRGYHNITLRDGNKKFQGSTFKMCPFSNYWRKRLDRICSEIMNKYNVDGIYLDEAANSAFNVGSCFAKDHNHKLGVTSDLVKAELRRDAGIYQTVNKIKPKTVLTGEGNSEVFNSIFASKLIHYEIWPGHVPTFQAVYHDYIASYGRSAKFNVKDNDPIYYMQVAWQLTTGAQIARFWPEKLKNKKVIKYLDYAARCTAIKANAGYRFISVGRMRKMPYVSKVKNITTRYFSRLNKLCTFPGVLTSAWESPEGEIALIATNILPETTNFEISVNPKDYEFSSKEISLKLLDGKGEIENLGNNKFKLTIEPYQVILLEINGERPIRSIAQEKVKNIKKSRLR